MGTFILTRQWREDKERMYREGEEGKERELKVWHMPITSYKISDVEGETTGRIRSCRTKGRDERRGTVRIDGTRKNQIVKLLKSIQRQRKKGKGSSTGTGRMEKTDKNSKF